MLLHISRRNPLAVVTLMATVWIATSSSQATAADIGIQRGICVLLNETDANYPVELAKKTELSILVQVSNLLGDNKRTITAIRRRADEAGLLGSRIVVRESDPKRVLLADQLADVIVVRTSDVETARAELLRALRPGGRLLQGDQVITKPDPKGTDDWSHPYHGPDNNPRSTDQLARAPYLTRFLATPWYCPMPQVTVISGGRMFKIFGHIAFKEREQPLLNRLIALNAYNGTILWERKLRDGFMVHRNTVIATPEVLYLADDQSCKMLDPATGKLLGEIIPPASITSDHVWKWMALQNGVLYAMLGKKEQPTVAIHGTRTAAGWPWNGMGRGYGQKNYPWGFGRVLMAIDPTTKKVLWSHKEATPLDSRATCLNQNQLFFYSHGKFLAAINIKSGKVGWKTTNKPLLDAIGQHDRAQNPVRGYSTSSYIKCTDEAVYFAGPQRRKLVAASAEDGRLLWQISHGNYQLILGNNAVYALGRSESSKKLHPLTGRILADLKCFRGNCTRATATVDSIFTRGYRHSGTQRVKLDSDESTRISLMRPACQDGVIVAGGLLYWGPWMCDCNLSLVGIISLANAGEFDFSAKATDAERLTQYSDDLKVATKEVISNSKDWSGYRGGPSRNAGTSVALPTKVRKLWSFQPNKKQRTTSVSTAGNRVFFAGADGAVRALNAATGKLIWTAYTGGEVRYAPSVVGSHVYVGSHDGFVYCFDAATGKRVWKFRAAPAERTIPVYGKLSSTWPVASGVLVKNGTVYAAAGIASYDGTHVVALDAATGKLRWHNNTSGNLKGAGGVTGVSVQGHLLAHRGKLYMAGGSAVSPAVYDLKNGKCLNNVDTEWGKAPRGRELYLVNNDVRAFDRLLYSPDPYQRGRYFSQSFIQAVHQDLVVRGAMGRIVRVDKKTANSKKPTSLWENKQFARIDALAIAGKEVVIVGRKKLAAVGKGAAGKADAKTKAKKGKPDDFTLAVLDGTNGKIKWQKPLSGETASWGLAIDSSGRIIITFADGRVIGYGK